MRALSIAWKDVRHTYRNVAGLAMMLVAPVLLAFLLGAAFGSGDDFSIAPVRTVVVEEEAGAAAGAPAAGARLTEALTSPGVANILTVDTVDTPEEARSLVDHGEKDVAVIIPAGLSAALMGSGLAQVEVYKDPTLSVGPAIVTAVVQSVVQSLDGARAAALTSVQLATSLGVTDPDGLAALAAGTAQAFGEKLGGIVSDTGAGATPGSDTTPGTGADTAHGPSSGAGIIVEDRAPVTPGAEAPKRPNVASQVLVGMMLFFMLFGASTPARSIIDEHRDGTLSRLFTTPTSRSLILGGKYMAVFLVVLIQSVILLLAGRFLLGARWGEMGPVALLTLTGALCTASLGLLTVSFAKTPAQAGAVSAAIFVFLGLISGNFVGTVSAEGTFATVRRISPLGWLLEGWGKILFGGSWSSIAVPVLATLGFTLVFFVVASLFFRRRYA